MVPQVGGKRGQWLQIKFMDAGPVDGRLINDGRRVRFYPTAKDGFLLRGVNFRGDDYFLQHIDFHKNSEHLVDSARFAFEVQVCTAYAYTLRSLHDTRGLILC
jgi:carbonic anhydrase